MWHCCLRRDMRRSATCESVCAKSTAWAVARAQGCGCRWMVKRKAMDLR